MSKISQKRLNDLADQIDAKADVVDTGFYGDPLDDPVWASHCRAAARALRTANLDWLKSDDHTPTSCREEIECGTDITPKELKEIGG